MKLRKKYHNELVHLKGRYRISKVIHTHIIITMSSDVSYSLSPYVYSEE